MLSRATLLNCRLSELSAKLLGGAKVKKTIDKKKQINLKATDESSFKAAFDLALKYFDAESVSFQDVLNKMSVDDLQKLNDYLEHDKTNWQKKLDLIATQCPEVQQLSVAIEKFEHVKVKLHSTLVEATTDECSKDGVFKMSAMQTMVGITLGVKKSKDVST